MRDVNHFGVIEIVIDKRTQGGITDVVTRQESTEKSQARRDHKSRGQHWTWIGHSQQAAAAVAQDSSKSCNMRICTFKCSGKEKKITSLYTIAKWL